MVARFIYHAGNNHLNIKKLNNMTIKASSPFYFINERGNLERTQEKDEIFTFVDCNTVKGKTYIVGKIRRPIFEAQQPIVETLNEGTENETTVETPQSDKLVRKDTIGELVTNGGKPLDINWIESDFAQKCEAALISELQAVEGNNGITFTSSILGE